MATDAEAIKYLWTHKTQDHPWLADEELVIDHGEGVWLWDEQGKRYLDATGGAMVVSLGHGRAEIELAASRSPERLETGARADELAECVRERPHVET